MSWLNKLLPPKINKDSKSNKSAVPEGLWSKCAACEAVLYHTDLENNLHVCPKCSHHNAVGARARLDMLLDGEGRFEIGSDVTPVDILKFKDSKKYPERLTAAQAGDGRHREEGAIHRHAAAARVMQPGQQADQPAGGQCVALHDAHRAGLDALGVLQVEPEGEHGRTDGKEEQGEDAEGEAREHRLMKRQGKAKGSL